MQNMALAICELLLSPPLAMPPSRISWRASAASAAIAAEGSAPCAPRRVPGKHGQFS